MVMYSKSNGQPVPNLPHRVFYNGRPYTDPTQWFPIVGAALGWAEVPDKPNNDARWSTADGEWKEKPSYNEATQKPPVWTGQAWSVPTKTLAERKANKIAAVEAKAQELIDAGFDYEIPASGNTYTYAIDDRTQYHMTAIQADLNNGGSGPQDGVWPDTNDIDRTFTDAQWEVFASAARTYKEGILRNLRLFIRDVNAATTVGGVSQANVVTGVGKANPTSGVNATGWPSNG